MPDHVPKLLLQVVLLYELDGWEGVEKYAKEHGIPVDICRKLLDEYVLNGAQSEAGQLQPRIRTSA